MQNNYFSFPKKNRLQLLLIYFPIFHSPITTVSPSNEFWGINQSIRYGTSTAILAQTAGIIDTGKPGIIDTCNISLIKYI